MLYSKLSPSRLKAVILARLCSAQRDIAYERKASEAGIYPLLDELSFIKDRQHWGIFFHRSLFSVSRDDFALIARAMGLDPRRL